MLSKIHVNPNKHHTIWNKTHYSLPPFTPKNKIYLQIKRVMYSLLQSGRVAYEDLFLHHNRILETQQTSYFLYPHCRWLWTQIYRLCRYHLPSNHPWNKIPLAKQNGQSKFSVDWPSNGNIITLVELTYPLIPTSHMTFPNTSPSPQNTIHSPTQNKKNPLNTPLFLNFPLNPPFHQRNPTQPQNPSKKLII